MRDLISRTPHEPKLAGVAALIADPTRARMLCYLLSGEFASAGELARAANVTPATMSGHLAKLIEAGLLACEQRGRHRYFRLADEDIARALEAIALVAERGSHDRIWASPTRTRLRNARCCYGHLAGRLGVEMFDQMRDQHWLLAEPEGFRLSESGLRGLEKLGIDASRWNPGALSKARLRIAYPCLDWSERRDHLAGPLAKGLLDHFMQSKWLRRHEGERALDLTPTGRKRLALILPSLERNAL